MNCPLYIDSCRECRDEIGFIPENTLGYCQSEKYKDCPFFKTINKIGIHCECVKKCPTYRHFKIYDFEKFVAMANKYCLSENIPNCERFKLRKAGKDVPEDLLPDGTKLAKDKP